MRKRPGDISFSPHRLALVLFVSVRIAWVAGMSFAIRTAILPPERSGLMLAVFEPGTPSDEIFAAIIRAGGNPVRETWLPFVWMAHGDRAGFAGALRSEGAAALNEFPLSPVLGGCAVYASALKSPISLRRSTP